jgi:peptidyl-prolyl cis-trans isomerase B (cyclophilin B)
MVLVAVMALAPLTACNPETSNADVSAALDGKADAGDAAADAAPIPPPETVAPAGPDANWPIKPYEDPHAVITMVGGAVVVVELEKELAPNTVENFIRLAEQKFYDGTVFHRVIPDFMAQGGSPDGQGADGPGWTIDLEIDPSLRHVRGSVSMARKPNPNSAGSQFYICYAPKSALDDQYAVFGKVVTGMDAVDGFKYGSTNPREMSQHGWDAPESGYPSTIETVRIVDGPPAS